MAGRPRKDASNLEVTSTTNTRSLEPTTLVSVMSNCVGTLVCVSSFTGRGFTIEGYGRMKRVQLQELENLYSEQPTIFEQGWLYILDHDVVDHMYLTELYESIVNPKDVDKFLTLSEEEIQERLENAPYGMKQTLAKVIKQKIVSGDDSLKVLSRIKFFEQVFDVKYDL